MPSPIAHSLIGLAIGLVRFLPRYRLWTDLFAYLRSLWRPLLFCIFLANAPDVDYLFGIFRGNLNYYHQTATHTLVWIGVTILAIWVYGWFRDRNVVAAHSAPTKNIDASGWFRDRRESWISLGLLLALLGSHLLADWLTVDRSPPMGLMLAWPFSDRFYHAASSIFPPPAKQTWADLWSAQNVRLVLAETAITLPLVFAVVWVKRRKI